MLPLFVVCLGVGFSAGGRSARAATLPSESRAVTTLRADTVRTTMDGVYTSAQALRGRDVFAAYCKSCHTATFHSGPTFRSKWYGRSVNDLYRYIRREMPKNAPGSMSDEEYTLAVVYLLRINGMPTGSQPLASDSTVLQHIRLDSVSVASSTPGTPQ